MQIRDRRNGYAPVLGRYCGTEGAGQHMRTTGSSGVVRFHSDDTVPARGFNIVFNARRGAQHFFPSPPYRPGDRVVRL